MGRRAWQPISAGSQPRGTRIEGSGEFSRGANPPMDCPRYVASSGRRSRKSATSSGSSRRPDISRIWVRAAAGERAARYGRAEVRASHKQGGLSVPVGQEAGRMLPAWRSWDRLLPPAPRWVGRQDLSVRVEHRDRWNVIRGRHRPRIPIHHGRCLPGAGNLGGRLRDADEDVRVVKRDVDFTDL